MFRFARKTRKSLKRRAAYTVLSLFLVLGGLGSFPTTIKAATCSDLSGTDIVLENCDLPPGSYYYSGTLLITGTVTAGSDTSSGQVYIFSDNITISSTGTLTAEGLGYNPGSGPGAGEAGSRGSGAGHGGHGGRSHYANASVGGPTYGSVREPSTLGSGGGNLSSSYGGDGGGAIKLVTTSTGTLTVDGTINADGENPSDYRNGGGAGGSIWLDAGTLDGDGTITAIGGTAASTSFGSGGGGGGRIAVYYSTDNSTLISGDKIDAYGGLEQDSSGDSESGGAGTVFLSDKTGSGDLIVDNNSIASTGTTSTSDQYETDLTFDNITIKGGTEYELSSGQSLTLSATGTLFGGGTNQASLNIYSGATFDSSSSTFFVNDLDVNLDGTFAGSSALTLADTDFDHDGAFSTTVTQLNFATASSTIFRNNGTGFNDLTLQVENNGTFVSEATGYDNLTSLTVKNAGTFSQANTAALDITTVTVESGGKIQHGFNSTSELYHLDITSTTFTIQSGGTVSVEGAGYNPGYGPGAGEAGSRGSGGGHGGHGARSHYANASIGGPTHGSAISPDHLGSGGGNLATSYGGDGGGAIKLTVSGTLTVDGSINADGDDPGDYRNGGGAGGSVWLDAGTLDGDGTITAIGGTANTTSFGSGGGGGGRIAVYYTTDNSTLISGDKIDAYGGIEQDSVGDAESGGAGTVFLSDKTGSGDLIVDNNNIVSTGTTSTSDQVGDLTFDNITISSGTKYVIPSGESLTLSATGTFTGGGTNQASMQVASGGTFDPSATSFTFDDIDVNNDGTISSVTSLTISDTDFDHDGALSATVTQLTYAAASGNTIFRNNGTGFNDLTLQIENNGFFMAETASYDNLTSLTVKNTGTFRQSHTSTLDITTVTVESGGEIDHANNTTTKTSVVDINATTIDIQLGGTVNVNALGYDLGEGPGDGKEASNAGGGGGYGGNGGYSHYGDVGGATYGSIREPNELGSGGGVDSASANGDGGGAVKLVASGTLTVNGTITADGGTATAAQNGGGSGGSIWLDASTLDGDGSVSVNGGTATTSTFSGGGGGGGRIAIYYTTDNSTLVSGAKYEAQGGNKGGSSGSDVGVAGGAGTVYISDRTGSGDLIVDNESRTNTGSTSTTTQITDGYTFDNITITGGAKYIVPSSASLTLSATGTLTGGGTNQASIQIASGGTFDPSTTSLTVDDLDFDLDGTLASATSLTISDSDFDHAGALSATVTQLTYAASTGTTYFRNRSGATGFNDLTLQVENNGIFVSGDTSYNNLTSLTVKNTGTFRQSHTSTITITTVTVESGGKIDHSGNSTAKLYVVDIAATTFDLQAGGTIDVDTLGFDLGQGPGAGGNASNSGGGGGYGGAGGDSHYGDLGGSTYGSSTAPDDLGSGGGDDGAANDGAGGGAIKLVVSGTLTVDGTITADGQTPGSNQNGGGSGGSIWLDADTYAGTGSMTADGGNGGNSTFSGGGGGGGRIYITYSTKTYTGSTPTVAGGLKGGTSGSDVGENGDPGTFTEEQKAPTVPTINSIYITPSTPTSSQSFTISASATFESGLDYVELFLDGTELTNRVAICYSGTATNTECTYEHGPVSGGSHTAYVKATGDDASTASDSVSFFVSTNTTENIATLERHKAGESTSFALTFTLTNTLSSSLTVTFPGSFTVTQAFQSGTCTSGTISNFNFTSTTLTADKSSCTGTVTLSGATITLPGTAGLYEVTWENDDPGSVIIPVTDDDQVTVSADVASELTFDLDISTSDSDTDAPYTLALGSLTSGSPAGSDDSGVSGIWVDLDTNATGGAVVQVQSTNASLASASAPGDTIPSSSGDVNGGTTARYGICVATAGSGVPTATVGTFQSVAPFSGATGGALGCTTTNSSVGALTTSFQTILNTNSNPIDGGRAQIRVKVDISDSTVGHDDYSDTLTFRATSTF